MARASRGSFAKESEGGVDRQASAMWPENCSWKEDGCKRDSSILVDRMQVSVKHVAQKKVQKSTGFIIVQSGTRLDVRAQRRSESGSQKREPQRRSGSGKEAL